MIACNKLPGLMALAAALLWLPVDMDARSRKGDKLLKLAHQAEDRKDYEKAVELYDQAIREDPQDPAYQLGARRVRFQASQVHVEAGMRLKKAGQLEEALVEFQKAFNIDPSSAIALQEIKETTDMLDQKRKLPAGQAPLSPVEQARKESMAMIEP